MHSLALPLPVSKPSPMQNSIAPRRFNASPNEAHYRNIIFQFKKGKLNLLLVTDSTNYSISFGSGKWEPGDTKKRGPSLTAALRGNRSEIYSYKIAGSYYWKTDSTLQLSLRYIESPHTETIRCTFIGSNVNVEFENSFNKVISAKFIGTPMIVIH
jgi:hypothetical protein